MLEADRDRHEQGQGKRVAVPHPLPELRRSRQTGADAAHENDGVHGDVALCLHTRLAGCSERGRPRVRGRHDHHPLNLSFSMPLRAVASHETDKPKNQALSQSRSLWMQNSARGTRRSTAPRPPPGAASQSGRVVVCSSYSKYGAGMSTAEHRRSPRALLMTDPRLLTDSQARPHGVYATRASDDFSTPNSIFPESRQGALDDEGPAEGRGARRASHDPN